MVMHVLKKERSFQTTPKFMLRGFFEKQKDFPKHLQEFSEVIFVIGGHAMHYTPTSGKKKIERGDILIIPAGGIHGYYDTNELRIFNLLFVADRLPMPLLELYSHPGYKYLFAHNLEFFNQKKPYPRMTLPEELFAEFEDLLQHFVKVQTLESFGRNCALLGLFMFILSRLCDNWSSLQHDKSSEIPLDISKVISYLNENFNSPVSLADMARLTAMSKNTFLRHFKSAVGRTPLEYIQHLRLDAGATLLLNTNLRIGEIAERVGFNDSSYFIRIFKKKYKCTPEAYRITEK